MNCRTLGHHGPPKSSSQKIQGAEIRVVEGIASDPAVKIDQSIIANMANTADGIVVDY